MMTKSPNDLGPAPEGWCQEAWKIQNAFLRGMKRALAKNPGSKITQRLVADQEKLIAGPQEGAAPK